MASYSGSSPDPTLQLNAFTTGAAASLSAPFTHGSMVGTHSPRLSTTITARQLLKAWGPVIEEEKTTAFAIGGSTTAAPTIYTYSRDVGAGTLTDAKSDYSFADNSDYVMSSIGQGWAYIPLKFFHKVTGRAVDEDGEPITDAKYIATEQNLGTVGFVDDEGYFSIYLLRVPYTEFWLAVESVAPYDLVWYRAKGGQRIDGKTDDIEMTFIPKVVKQPIDATLDLDVGL